MKGGKEFGSFHLLAREAEHPGVPFLYVILELGRPVSDRINGHEDGEELLFSRLLGICVGFGFRV